MADRDLRIRLVTYNIRKGKGASGRLDGSVEAMSQALSSHKLDLLLCQEVFHGRRVGVSQSTQLAKSLGLNHYYEPNKHRRVGHHGNATFTHFSVDFIRNFNISTNPIERRGALYARLNVNGLPLHVLNVHLGLNERQRMKQLERLETIIEDHSHGDEPVILAGDFNDWNRRLDLEIRHLGYHDAFAHLARHERHTWHARRPLFNLDRVYLRNLDVVRVHRFVGAPWRDLSDHLPLWAELKLR